jgi:hypothetical protein
MSEFIPNIPPDALKSQLRRLHPEVHDAIHIRRVMHAAAARLEELEARIASLTAPVEEPPKGDKGVSTRFKPKSAYVDNA